MRIWCEMVAPRITKLARNRAEEKYGSAFQFLGPDLQRAVIAYELVAILASQEAKPDQTHAARIIEAASALLED